MWCAAPSPPISIIIIMISRCARFVIHSAWYCHNKLLISAEFECTRSEHKMLVGFVRLVPGDDHQRIWWWNESVHLNGVSFDVCLCASSCHIDKHRSQRPVSATNAHQPSNINISRGQKDDRVSGIRVVVSHIAYNYDHIDECEFDLNVNIQRPRFESQRFPHLKLSYFYVTDIRILSAHLCINSFFSIR